MKVTVIEPRGYCSGVNRAITIALKAKEENKDKKVYVLGMLVHNTEVIQMLNEHSLITLANADADFMDLIDDNSVIVFTAHGHNIELDTLAKNKDLKIYDAICPRVKLSNDKIKEYLSHNTPVFYIGIYNHPETVASLSLGKNIHFIDAKNPSIPEVNGSPAVLNQTTLNILEITKIHEDIKEKYPDAVFENEICNTTRMRQTALLNLEEDVDTIIVIGDQKSSNSKRLYEIAKANNPTIDTFMISTVDDIDSERFANKNHIVISSGASTPNETIDAVVNKLNNLR